MAEPVKATAGAISAKDEWKAGWPYPFVGMLGYTGAACFAYSSGVFMQSVTQEFGWSRAVFSSAFMVQTLVAMLVMPMVGRVVDLYGARRIALFAIGPFVIGYGLLALANGADLAMVAALLPGWR